MNWEFTGAIWIGIGIERGLIQWLGPGTLPWWLYLGAGLAAVLIAWARK